MMLTITIEDDRQEETLNERDLTDLESEIEDTIAHLLGHEDCEVSLDQTNIDVEIADSMEHISIPGTETDINLAVDFKDTPYAHLEEHESEESPSVLAYDADLESVPSEPDEPVKLNYSSPSKGKIYAIVNHTTQTAVDAFSNRSDAVEHRQELSAVSSQFASGGDYTVRPVVPDENGLRDTDHGRVYDNQTERDISSLQDESEPSKNEPSVSPSP